MVFDEAHHLTAYRTGGKVRKTENYKLAEALKGHTRDLLLLSATPHQGNHFQFWMLIQLLNPTLFGGPEEMVEHRHRLNTVMYRRTKADACKPDGEPLFARRWVHTESFLMQEQERGFYEKLREYLEDGFDLAKRKGNQGRALGFLMAIFQKIAASSFAAVRRTLKRRLLMLTLKEALLRDRELDIEGRERLYDEARELIHLEWDLAHDPIVFDLFQDLDGFSLDEYQPFSDVSTGMERIVQFMGSSIPDRQQRLAKIDDQTYDVTAADGSRKVRFTLNRDVATSQDGIELLGLDHPLVQEELGRWRSLAPDQIGLSVTSDDTDRTLLSFWLVESAVANGERRTTVQTIAVQPDGTRMPAVERQSGQYLNAPVAKPFLTTEERLGLFSNVVEPTLQRELKHKGLATGDGSYSAELVGYVEIANA